MIIAPTEVGVSCTELAMECTRILKETMILVDYRNRYGILKRIIMNRRKRKIRENDRYLIYDEAGQLIAVLNERQFKNEVITI